jgi:amino acid adenylation domain-containing protein
MMSVITSPLSCAQERVWFLEQFSPGTATYNVPMVLDVAGPLEHHVLERSVGEIVRRHEPLRTLFHDDEGRPYQVVQPYEPFAIPLEVCRGMSEEEIERRIASDICKPFDLERGPIFRARLLRLAETRHVLILAVHHIGFDGWSMGVFFRELSALYAAYAAGQASPLPSLPTRYVDFAVAQRERLTSEAVTRQMDYWRRHLRAPLPVLTLPADRTRPPLQTSRGQRDTASLPDTIIARLQEVGRRSGATLFMALAATYAVFLHRLSAQTDLVIGTTIANRTRLEIEPLIGFFVNSLALRISIRPEMTIRQVLAAVIRIAEDAYANQEVPFARIVEALNPARDPSRPPIFQTLFTFDNTPHAVGDGVVAGPLTLRRRFASTGTSKFDLGLSIRRGADGLRVALESNADLFDATTGTRMLHGFCRLLSVVPDHMDTRIDGLPAAPALSAATVAGPQEPTRMWAGEAAPYPRDATVASLFEIQARRTPDATAVVDGPVAWTYRDLNEGANRLAHLLRGRCRDFDGESTPPAIGVCLERSADAVVALLAVLKAGGAYVPLDPSSPPARLTALAARAHLRLIVTAEGFAGRLTSADAALVVLEREASTIAREPAIDPQAAVSADRLAYILFTSGTTGTPKAVGVPHRAIVRLVYGLPCVPLGKGQTVLLGSPLFFDVATFELWGPLLHGGCIAIGPPLMMDTRAVARVVAMHNVTVMVLTASFFNAIADDCLEALAPVRYLIAGGEMLSIPHIARAMAALPGTRFFNAYGPTEATTFATCHEIAPRDLSSASGIPIGRPLLNTCAYVLDESGHAVEPGEAGELWIGGDALALGYLDDPKLTAARFVPDPFAQRIGARMFRSGDRVRFFPDGTLEFLGRLDDQIKLRGFRIEPGEVEAAIGRYAAVAQCAVVAVELSAVGRTLVAFYVPAPDAGEDASPRRLSEFLRDHLPEYMIPARWKPVSMLPLLKTGKIDRQALKAQAISDDLDRAKGVAAGEGTHGIGDAVASIWREVLGVAEVHPGDHFFDRGGHSLLALQMLSRVRATFGVEVGIRTVFETPTLAGLSQVIAALTRSAAPFDL